MTAGEVIHHLILPNSNHRMGDAYLANLHMHSESYQ